MLCLKPVRVCYAREPASRIRNRYSLRAAFAESLESCQGATAATNLRIRPRSSSWALICASDLPGIECIMILLATPRPMDTVDIYSTMASRTLDAVRTSKAVD